MDLTTFFFPGLLINKLIIYFCKNLGGTHCVGDLLGGVELGHSLAEDGEGVSEDRGGSGVKLYYLDHVLHS